jgi:hypothetical protein
MCALRTKIKPVVGRSFRNANRWLTVEGPCISLGEPGDDHRLDSADRIQQSPRSPGEVWMRA